MTETNSNDPMPESKKRRILLTSVSPETNRRRKIQPTLVSTVEKVDSSSIRTSLPSSISPSQKFKLPQVRLSNGSQFKFENTATCEVRQINSTAQFLSLLASETKRAKDTQHSWVRHSSMKWIQEMISELKPEQKLKLDAARRKLETSDGDFLSRWADSSEYASEVINLWFEDKTLDDVITRSKELGHMDTGMVSGCILEGSVISSLLSMKKPMKYESLLPSIKKMSTNGKVSLYKVSEDNIFQVLGKANAKISIDDIIPGDFQGSLNTTWDCSNEPSGVDFLDNYHSCLDELLYAASDHAFLNNLMYLIWKFKNYATAYHQDTHVPPHYTLYSQISGMSVFHFLPVLVGLYVTYVGSKDASKLRSLLKTLDDLKIGSVATIGEGQVALILPFGSHGVWVPSSKANPSYPSFDMSVIRAAEVFIQPMYVEYEKLLMTEKWNERSLITAEEAEILEAFRQTQKTFEKKHGLSFVDWHWLAKKYLREREEENAEPESGNDAQNPVEGATE